MFLVIDAGNTNTVFAVFEGDDLVEKWRLSADHKRTAEEYMLFLKQFFELSNIEHKKIKNVMISSVVPKGLFALKMLCLEYFGCEALVIGEENVKIGVRIKIERPGDVGADRLANAVAAYKKFGGNIIVIDFGTATNFDVIDKNGAYIGGIISPGINLSLEALHVAAAKLPEIEVAKPPQVIGQSTITAMQSGVYWGYICLIEGLINKIMVEYGEKMTVVATGGLAALFFKAIDAIDYLEPELTVFGLKEILSINLIKASPKAEFETV